MSTINIAPLYAYRPRPSLPTSPETEAHRASITKFVRAYPQNHASIGDDLATTYTSAGLVILAAAVSASRSPKHLSAITGFLQEFSEAVCTIMTRHNYWTTPWFLDLVDTVESYPSYSSDWLYSFEAGLESFWSGADFPSFRPWLEITRARLIFPGELQPYLDDEYCAEYFGLTVECETSAPS